MDVRCVAPVSRELLYLGTADARLLRWSSGALGAVAGFDDAPGRHRWYTPWGGPPDCRSIDTDGSRLLVNVHVGGILRSEDAGVSWTATIDLDVDVHQVKQIGGRILAATGVSGLAVSDDGGQTWSYRVDGLHGSYARAVAVVGGTVLLASSTGPFTREAALYRRPLDGGGPFERCAGGLPERFDGNVDTHWVDAHVDVAAVVTPGGQVYVSDDEGRTWALLAREVAAPRAVVVD